MPIRGRKRNRTEGACLPCSRKKRKCDHLVPRCSQCVKHDDVCEKRNFRTWSGPETGKLIARSNLEHTDFQGAVNEQELLLPLKSNADIDCHIDLPSPHIVPPSHTVTPVFLTTPTATHGIQETQQTSTVLQELPDWTVADDTQSLTPNRHKAVIKPVLPWPRSTEMTKSHPQSFLWEFFYSNFLKNLLIFEPQDCAQQTSFEDPFVILFPPMALESPSLLAAVSSFALKRYTGQKGQQTISFPPTYFSSQAIQSLISLELSTIQPKSLLPIIATGLFLHLTEQDEERNYLDLSRSAAAFLADIASTTSLVKSQEYQLVMVLLRVVEISTMCSLQVRNTTATREIHKSIQLRSYEVRDNFSNTFNHWITHPIFGFSAHLVNPLLELGRLFQLQLQESVQPDAENRVFDTELDTQALELEEAIVAASRNFEASRQSKKYQDLEPVINLNAAMHTATELLFYSRMRRMPWTAPAIRRYVREIMDHASRVPQSSRAASTLLFPLCVAGCEAVDESVRAMLVELVHLYDGFKRPETLVATLQQVWDIRDQQPGLLWPQWVKKVEKRYRDAVWF